MTDALLVSLAKAVSAELTSAATASPSAFELSGLDIDWDYKYRDREIPAVENQVYVRVMVPEKYENIESGDRDSLDWSAFIEIHVIKKFGTPANTVSQTVAKDEITALVRLVEQIHGYFQETLSERRFTLTAHGRIAEWIDERKGYSQRQKSEIAATYDGDVLREGRVFLGVCRELFEMTVGT